MRIYVLDIEEFFVLCYLQVCIKLRPRLLSYFYQPISQHAMSWLSFLNVLDKVEAFFDLAELLKGKFTLGKI